MKYLFFIAGLLFLLSCQTIPSTIVEHTMQSEQLYREVNNWVYLPPNYERGKAFPVIIFQDGQNLFYDSLAFAGEWQVDEVFDSLYEEEGLQLVAVGIENGGEERINELTPYSNETYGGGNADAYLAYVKEELLPELNANFSISQNIEDWALFGSSLGGLITFYEAFQPEQQFVKFGVYSPSFWYAEDVFELPTQNQLKKNTKMVLRIGEQEQNEHFNVLKMDSLLQIHQPNIQLKTTIDADGEHSEWYWSRHLYEDVLWLFR